MKYAFETEGFCVIQEACKSKFENKSIDCLPLKWIRWTLFSEMKRTYNRNWHTYSQINVKNSINGMFTNDLHIDFELNWISKWQKRSWFVYYSLWMIHLRWKQKSLSISKCYLYTQNAPKFAQIHEICMYTCR